MTKVFCQKYKKELTKLNSPPFPGAVGQEIFDKYSKEAWDEWLSLQTMLINEGGLDLSVKENRKMAKWANETISRKWRIQKSPLDLLRL